MTAVREATPEEVWDKLAAQAGPVRHGRWSRTDLLLARVGDLLAYTLWANSKRDTPPPEPLPRPGVKRNGDVASNLAAIKHLERLRDTRGGHVDG